VTAALATTLGVNSTDITITSAVDYDPAFCDSRLGSYGSSGYSADVYEPNQVPTLIIHYQVMENEETDTGRLGAMAKAIDEMDAQFNGEEDCVDIITLESIECEASTLRTNIKNQLTLAGINVNTDGMFVNSEKALVSETHRIVDPLCPLSSRAPPAACEHHEAHLRTDTCPWGTLQGCSGHIPLR
jgi:hypothetical protein